jgi:hypothetical protein
MGGGDVAHVEGWILPQPHDVDIGKVQIDGLTEMGMIARTRCTISGCARATTRPSRNDR